MAYAGQTGGRALNRFLVNEGFIKTLNSTDTTIGTANVGSAVIGNLSGTNCELTTISATDLNVTNNIVGETILTSDISATTIGVGTAQVGQGNIGHLISASGDIVTADIQTLTVSNGTLNDIVTSNLVVNGNIVFTGTISGELEASLQASVDTRLDAHDVSLAHHIERITDISESYLKKSGGTMTGDLYTTKDLYVGGISDESTIFLGGGSGDDGSTEYNHSLIATREYDVSKSELVIFKGNDSGANPLTGPDRIRLRGGNIVFDTYASPTTNYTDESPKMIINRYGNVGVGTVTPMYVFDVNGSLRASGNVYFGGNVGVGIVTPAYVFDVNGSLRASGNIYFGGNVGIGKDATKKLDISGGLRTSDEIITGTDTNGYIRFVTSGKNAYLQAGDTFTANSSTKLIIAPISSGSAIFTFDISEEKFGIMNENPTYSLDVNGDANIYDTLYVNNGKVAIGSTSSIYELGVNGALQANALFVGSSSSSGATIYMGGGSSDDNGYDHSTISTREYTTGKSEMVLFKGNDISGSSGADRIRLRAGAIAFDTISGPTVGISEESIKMYIDGSGRVGVGTVTPSTTLDVSGEAKVTDLVVTGNATFLGNVSLDVTFTGETLQDGTLDGTTTLSGGHIFDGVALINGNTTISGELSVSNDTVLLSDLSVNGTTQVQHIGSSTLTVGMADISDSANVFETLGDGRVYGDFRVDGSLNLGPASVTLFDDSGRLIIQHSGGNGMIFDFTDPSNASIRPITTDGNSKVLLANEPDGQNPQLYLGTAERVGINTDAPLYTLDVSGDAHVKSTAYIDGDIISSNSGNSSIFRMTKDGNSVVLQANRGTNDVSGIFHFAPYYKDGASATMTIDLSERMVGINNINPEYTLDVSGPIHSISNTFVEGNVGIGKTSASYPLDVSGDIHSSGSAIVDVSVGIGTTTPAYTLDVSGTIRSVSNTFIEGNVGIGKTSASYPLDVSGDIHSSGSAIVDVSVGIGTTTPAYTLDVSGDANIYNTLYVNNGKVSIGVSNSIYELGVSGALQANSLYVGGESDESTIYLGGGNANDSGYHNSIIKTRSYDGHKSELIIFKGDDIIDPIGPDRIRLRGPNIVFDTCTSADSSSYSTENIRMKIDDIGRVLIGQPPSEVFQLEVSGTIRTTNDVRSMTNIIGDNTNGGIRIDTLNGIGYIQAGDTYSFGKKTKIMMTPILERTGIFTFDISEQKFGIMNENPTYSLDVSGQIRSVGNTFIEGNVGIGKTSASYPLDVSGDIYSSADVLVGGSVGIGTTTPAYTLDVSGSIHSVSNVFIEGSAIVDVSVGIGTTNPAYTLDVSGPIHTVSDNYVDGTLFVGKNVGDTTGGTIKLGGIADDNEFRHCVLQTRQYNNQASELVIFKGNDGNNGAGPDRVRLKGGAIAFDTYPDSTYSTDVSNIRMYITPTGNVGIGTTNPTNKLEVVGSAQISSYANIYGDIISPNSGSGSIFRMTKDGETVILQASRSTNDVSGIFHFAPFYKDGASATMTIDLSNRMVGINNSNPEYSLDVSGPARIVKSLRIGREYSSILNGSGETLGGTIYFGGVSDDVTYNESLIQSRLYDNGNASELVIFKGNDDSVPSGPDRIRLKAAAIAFDTSNSATTDYITETTRMYIAPDGKVGIGTTIPSYTLDVNGDVRIGTVANSNLYIGGKPAVDGKGLRLHSINENRYIDVSNGYTYFRTGVNGESHTLMTMDCTNNRIGINDTTPEYNIDVNGTIRSTGILYVGQSATGGGTIKLGGVTDDADYDHCVIQSRTYDNAKSELVIFKGNDGYDGPGPDRIRLNSGAIAFDTFSDASLNIGVRNIRMYIAPDGYVGIATTTPAYPLHVDIANSVDDQVGVSTVRYFDDGSTTINTSADGSTHFTPGISIKANAFIWATKGFIAASDRRIKTDISDINDQQSLTLFRQIQPKTYTYVDKLTKGTSTVYGYIAQEIEEIIPDAITLETEIIPDYYNTISGSSLVLTGTTLTITPDVSYDVDLSQNIKCYIRDVSGSVTEVFKPVTEISGSSFNIELDSTVDLSDVFLYGREVSDFHTLNKDYIWTVASAALQEVDRNVETLRKTDHIIRGTLALIDSSGSVTLDLAESAFTDPQVFVQNNVGWSQVRGSLSGNVLTVEAKDPGCTDTIDYMVVVNLVE